MQHYLTPGAAELALRELQKCKAILGEFADLLEKYDPRNTKHEAKGLKALVSALKKGSRESMMSRLERHKQALILALMGLFVFVPRRRPV